MIFQSAWPTNYWMGVHRHCFMVDKKQELYTGRLFAQFLEQANGKMHMFTVFTTNFILLAMLRSSQYITDQSAAWLLWSNWDRWHFLSTKDSVCHCSTPFWGFSSQGVFSAGFWLHDVLSCVALWPFQGQTLREWHLLLNVASKHDSLWSYMTIYSSLKKRAYYWYHHFVKL